MLPFPTGFRLERGLLWPEEDHACAAVVFDTTSDLEHAYRHVKNWDLAVQAGGNMGVWPLHMAKSFFRVVTFEADPRNFQALVYNTAPARNILALPFALGHSDGDWVKTELTPEERGNVGAYQVAKGDTTPVMRLDTLNLPACGLIYLDIEGFELYALQGALHTIRRFKPVIAFEDKGLSERYGYHKGDIEYYLKQEGYQVVARPHRDVVMVHMEH